MVRARRRRARRRRRGRRVVEQRSRRVARSRRSADDRGAGRQPAGRRRLRRRCRRRRTASSFTAPRGGLRDRACGPERSAAPATRWAPAAPKVGDPVDHAVGLAHARRARRPGGRRAAARSSCTTATAAASSARARAVPRAPFTIGDAAPPPPAATDAGRGALSADDRRTATSRRKPGRGRDLHGARRPGRGRRPSRSASGSIGLTARAAGCRPRR